MKLTFEQLRRTNKRRCVKHFHKIEDWSEVAWACALAGEVGEFCNWMKKRHRRINSDKYQGEDISDYKEDAKKELGDIIAYADLCATNLGLRLEDCVRDKFNEVSKRIKARHRL